MTHIAIADEVVELHDPTSFISKYIWSQDHKVIAIQYGVTAIMAVSYTHLTLPTSDLV